MKENLHTRCWCFSLTFKNVGDTLNTAFSCRKERYETCIKVTKRDGEITEFNLTKISEAIRKAFEAREKEYNQDIIDLLALKVTADFEPKIKEHKIAVEDIQDSVESVLIKAGYADVAKGYILYRKQREKNPKI